MSQVHRDHSVCVPQDSWARVQCPTAAPMLARILPPPRRMFFHSWASLGHVVLITTGTFIGLVALLRIAGAQVQAKMSSFDGIVTVTMGSIVATVALAT